MWYFLWGCRRTLKLITFGSERVNSRPNCEFLRLINLRWADSVLLIVWKHRTHKPPGPLIREVQADDVDYHVSYRDPRSAICWAMCRSIYRPNVDRYLVDDSGSRHLGRYVGGRLYRLTEHRHIDWRSVDMSIEGRSMCRSRIGRYIDRHNDRCNGPLCPPDFGPGTKWPIKGTGIYRPRVHDPTMWRWRRAFRYKAGRSSLCISVAKSWKSYNISPRFLHYSPT